MNKFCTLMAAACSVALIGTTAVIAGTMKSEFPMVGGAAMYPAKNIIENASQSKDHTTLVNNVP